MRIYLAAAAVLMTLPLIAQHGATNGEWRFYGGDAGNTKYSPLDQINATNVKDLKIVWEWKAQNLGKRPDYNWEATPLEINGVLYVTAGTRRDAVAIDAVTGETLWMYRLDEGARGNTVARPQNRGLAYWSDGKGDERVIMISPGFQLVVLNAKTGQPIPNFGSNGLVDLTKGLDRDVVKPGQIGSSSPALVIRDTIVVGPALTSGTAPPSKTNVPGYIRGYDVRTGKLLWTFHTVPQKGEEGTETWENESWKYSGNTGAWAPLAGDEELGYVYIPVEMPTGDFYGGTHPGNNLFSDSLVCLDARTGKRIWYFQEVHHDIWDMDIAAPPIVTDITVDGRKVKAVASVTKEGNTFVFDRVTGKPIWPIVERPVPQSDVPGEKTSPTQPFPTKPPAFEHQGTDLDFANDMTPAINEEAKKIMSTYKLGPLFTPPIMADTDGKKATLLSPSHVGGSNWEGGAFDPETGMLYVSSTNNPDALSIQKVDPSRSDMGYIGGMGGGRGGAGRGGAGGGRGAGAPPATFDPESRPVARVNIGPEGLPLVKPPYGSVVAIDLNKGDIAWRIPNGDTPEYIKNHPLLKGVNIPNTGKPSRAPIIITKTLMFTADGSNLFNGVAGGGGTGFRAVDKATGKVISELQLPSMATGIPMTYMVDGRQFIVVAVGAAGVPAELVALALP
jgi:quinoprotein glucose dehydrogenase